MSQPDVFWFEGSEVGDIQLNGADLVIRFSAAHVQRDLDAAMTQGHLSQVYLRLQLQDATGQCSWDEWIGALSGGMLEHEGRTQRTVSLPFVCPTSLQLTLHFHGRGTLSLSGQNMCLEASPESRFFESYAC